MKKVFIALIFMCVVGAGILWWLMQSSSPPSPHFENMPSGEEHASENPHEAAAPADHAAEPTPEAATEDAHAKHDAEAGPQLSISTEPVSAKVFVGEELKGQSPLTLPLGEAKQMIRFEADGFEPYSKEAPALAEAGEESELNWKIQLRAKKGALESSPRAAAQNAHAHAPSAAPAGEFFHGEVGPYFVQLEALPYADEAQKKDALHKVSEFRVRHKKVKACVVELAAKGTWLRILAGPLKNKILAKKELKKIQSLGGDGPFVTGAQKCL